MIPDANRSILHTVAMLGILGLGFWASPAAAQLAPWQQPPGSDRADRQTAPNPLPEGEGTSAICRSGGHHDPSRPVPTRSIIRLPLGERRLRARGHALGFRPRISAELGL